MDIDDVDGFCATIVVRSKLELRPHQREELHAYLITECWRLSLRYEPGTGSTTSFIGWATTNLRLRVVDWERKEFGRNKWQFRNRTYERKRPQFVSLDSEAGDQLERSLAEGAGNSEADRDEIDGGLLGDRDRSRVEDERLMGLEADY